jgi:hypothetical protein
LKEELIIKNDKYQLEGIAIVNDIQFTAGLIGMNPQGVKQMLDKSFYFQGNK